MKRYKRIYIEITNACNLSCEFCPKTKRPAKLMTVENFELILNRIKGFTDHIYLHVLGEPLMHHDLKEFLALAHKYDLNVNITTNGTLIDRQTNILLNSPALRQVNISLHSFDANETEATAESYMKNILNFIIEAKNNSKPLCALRLWNFSEEVSALDNSVNVKDIDRNEHLLLLLEERLNLDYKIKDKLIGSRKLKLADNIYLNAASRFYWPIEEAAESDNTGFCHGLRDQIGILVDGSVIPCCLDGEGIINLGNILETPLDSIINSKRARDIYTGFSNRKVVEDLCRKCDYRRRFNK